MAELKDNDPKKPPQNIEWGDEVYVTDNKPPENIEWGEEIVVKKKETAEPSNLPPSAGLSDVTSNAVAKTSAADEAVEGGVTPKISLSSASGKAKTKGVQPVIKASLPEVTIKPKDKPQPEHIEFEATDLGVLTPKIAGGEVSEAPTGAISKIAPLGQSKQGRYNQAHEYASKGVVDKSNDIIEELLKEDPNDAYAHRLLAHNTSKTISGNPYATEDEHRLAANQADLAKKHNPSDVSLYNTAAYHKMMSGDIDGGVKDADIVIRSLGRTAGGQTDVDEAYADLPNVDNLIYALKTKKYAAQRKGNDALAKDLDAQIKKSEYRRTRVLSDKFNNETLKDIAGRETPEGGRYGLTDFITQNIDPITSSVYAFGESLEKFGQIDDVFSEAYDASLKKSGNPLMAFQDGLADASLFTAGALVNTLISGTMIAGAPEMALAFKAAEMLPEDISKWAMKPVTTFLKEAKIIDPNYQDNLSKGGNALVEQIDLLGSLILFHQAGSGIGKVLKVGGKPLYTTSEINRVAEKWQKNEKLNTRESQIVKDIFNNSTVDDAAAALTAKGLFLKENANGKGDGTANVPKPQNIETPKITEVKDAEGIGTEVRKGSETEGVEGQAETGLHLRDDAKDRVETETGEPPVEQPRVAPEQKTYSDAELTTLTADIAKEGGLDVKGRESVLNEAIRSEAAKTPDVPIEDVVRRVLEDEQTKEQQTDGTAKTTEGAPEEVQKTPADTEDVPVQIQHEGKTYEQKVVRSGKAAAVKWVDAETGKGVDAGVKRILDDKMREQFPETQGPPDVSQATVEAQSKVSKPKEFVDKIIENLSGSKDPTHKKMVEKMKSKGMRAVVGEVQQKVAADALVDWYIKDHDGMANPKNMENALNAALSHTLDKKVAGGVDTQIIARVSREFADLGQKTGDKQYTDKAAQIMADTFLNMATDAGRALRSFQTAYRSSPFLFTEFIKRYYKGKVMKGARKQKKIAAKAKEFNAAIKQASADIAEKAMSEQTPETVDTRIASKRARVEKAKQNRVALVEEMRANKAEIFGTGQLGASIIPGLTPKGIEYIGKLAKVLAEEGYARADLMRLQLVKILKEQLDIDVKEDDLKKLFDADLKDVSEYIKEREKEYWDEAPATTKTVTKGTTYEQKTELAATILEHFEGNDPKPAELSQQIQERLNVSKERADGMADLISAEFPTITKELRAGVLKRMFPGPKLIKPFLKKSRQERLNEKLVASARLKVFGEEEFADLAAEKLGLPNFNSPEVEAKMTALARKVVDTKGDELKKIAEQDLWDYVSHLYKESLMDAGMSQWYANILSGPVTHIKNTDYNAVRLAMEMVYVQLFKTGGRGAIKTLWQHKGEGFTEMAHVLRTGRPRRGEAPRETPSSERRRSVFGIKYGKGLRRYPGRFLSGLDATLNIPYRIVMERGLMLREAFIENNKLPKEQRKPKSEIEKVINEHFLNTSERANDAFAKANEAVREFYGLDGDVMLKDERGRISRNPAYKGGEYRDAYRNAKRQFYDFMEKTRPAEVVYDATKLSNTTFLMSKPTGTFGAVATMLEYGLSFLPPLRIVTMPFVNVPLNVAKYMVDYMPVVGWAKAELNIWKGFEGFSPEWQKRHGVFKELTDSAKEDLRKKTILSTATFAGVSALTQVYYDDEKDGRRPLLIVYGPGYNDYGKNLALTQSTGGRFQPYTIDFMGFPMSYKTSPAAAFLLGAGVWHDQDEYGINDNESTGMRLAGAMWQYLMFSTEQANMKALSETYEFISTFSKNMTEGNLLKGTGKTFVDGTIKTFKALVVPNFITQTTQGVRTFMQLDDKQANTTYDVIFKGIPILTEMLDSRLDYQNRPIKQMTDIPIANMYLLGERKADGNWIDDLFVKHHYLPPYVSKKTIYDEKEGGERDLTKEERYKFIKIRNRVWLEMMDELEGDLKDSGVGDYEFSELMKKLYQKADKVAMYELFDEEDVTTTKYKRSKRYKIGVERGEAE